MSDVKFQNGDVTWTNTSDVSWDGSIPLEISNGTHVLASDALQMAPTLDNKVHFQNGDVIWENTDDVSFVGIQRLNIADATHTVVTGTPAITRKTSLTIANSQNALSSANVSTVVLRTLSAADAQDAHTSQSPNISKLTNLEISGSEHVLSSPNIDTNRHKGFIVQNPVHVATSSNVYLIKEETLRIDNVSHSPVSDSPSLKKTSTLSIANSAHSFVFASPSLLRYAPLLINNDAHLLTSENLALTRIKIFYRPRIKIWNDGQWKDLTVGTTWIEASGNINAAKGYGYAVDTASGTALLMLPMAPSVGDKIPYKDAAGAFATHNLTISGSGKKIRGSENAMVISTAWAQGELVFMGDTKGWI
ncbi:MAG: hypothetical protein CSYNP_03560 [Syntrophus sp. SKADARSKE-3]|nr:hypothetical protein [Syntrophus sp. SKADARSKE-3]